jgi:hypothetical protein
MALKCYEAVRMGNIQDQIEIFEPELRTGSDTETATTIASGFGGGQLASHWTVPACEVKVRKWVAPYRQDHRGAADGDRDRSARGSG